MACSVCTSFSQMYFSSEQVWAWLVTYLNVSLMRGKL